jgi:predicted RNA-binding protein YlxR (DUF448 family)
MPNEARESRRTCVGCRKTARRDELLRFARTENARLVPDVRGRLPGRGAWVHARRDCIGAAAAHGFARSFRTAIRANAAELAGAAAETCRSEVDRVVVALGREHALVHDEAALVRAAADEGAVLLHAADALPVAREVVRARWFTHRTRSTLRALVGGSLVRNSGRDLEDVSVLAIERRGAAREIVSLLERAIGLSEDA